MSVYTKEWVTTVGFFLLYLLAGHTAVWALWLGYDLQTRILGYPVHYFAVLVLGWLGVLLISIIWDRVAERLEQQITNHYEPES